MDTHEPTSAVSAQQHEPHVAMKDSAFDWGFDDLGQLDADLELRTSAPQPRTFAPERKPTLH